MRMTPRNAALVFALMATGACEHSTTTVGPPTKADTTCDQASDCVAWPSGCCEWKAINVAYRGPPGPDAGCEMECVRVPSEVVCEERACTLVWADERTVPLKHPSR